MSWYVQIYRGGWCIGLYVGQAPQVMAEQNSIGMQYDQKQQGRF